MSLIIQDSEVERLVAEVAAATGETETEVVRRAVADRRDKIAQPSIEERWQSIREGLERDVWSKLPAEARGKRISQREQDEILGYGSDGYCV